MLNLLYLKLGGTSIKFAYLLSIYKEFVTRMLEYQKKGKLTDSKLKEYFTSLKKNYIIE